MYCRLCRPLNDTPPLGLTLIERTMRFFWPIMECDLRSTSPWVLSPLFATMSRVHVHTRQPGSVSADVDSGKQRHTTPAVQKYLHEDSSTIPLTQLESQAQQQLPPWPGIMTDAESENAIAVFAPRTSGSGSTRSRAASYCPEAPTSKPRSSLLPSLSHLSLSSPRSKGLELSAHSKARKQHFSAPSVRLNTPILPTDTITTDFKNSFINFQDFSLSVPGVPFRVNLSRYMVGKPVQYVCRSRTGDVFWAIIFTILRDD